MKNSNSILQSIVTFGLFIVPLTPLIVVSSYFFPFITGKAFFFRIIVEIITALWLILALRNKKYLPQFSWITVALTIFTFVVLIADLSGMNPHKSLWSNFERMEGWVTIVHLWLYYLVASSMLTTSRIWEKLINTSIGVSFLLVVYAFAQLVGLADIHQGSTRLDASLGNAAYFAVYLLIHIFLTLFMLYRKWGNKVLVWLYGIVLLLQLFILYYTGTRGTILGLVGGVVVSALIIAVKQRNEPKVRNLGVGIIVGVLSIVGVFMMVKNTAFVRESYMLNRLASINMQDAAPRLAIWSMAFEGFKERPVFGWGQENFNYVFNENYKPSMYAQEQWFDRAHNVFFDWLIAAGIVGLLSYLSLFGVALWYIWKKDNDGFDFYEKVIFTGLLTAYFIHNLFVFDHLVSYIFFITILAYIHSFSKKREIKFLEQLSNKNVAFYAVPIIFIFLLLSLYYVNIRPMNASKSLINALVYQQDPVKSLEYFRQALKYGTVGTQEIREQLASAAVGYTQKNIDKAVLSDFFNLANEELKLWVEESPMDARAHLFYGTFLSRYGLSSEAQKRFERAVELSPNKQTMMFELGSHYLTQGKKAEALAVFKRAYESNVEFEDARLMYAIASIYAGDQSRANTLLATFENRTDVLTDRRLVSAYAATGNFQKVISIYIDLLKSDPSNVQIRSSLAAAYLMADNSAAAIRELQKAIEFNPEFKEQGEYFINEIRAGRNPAQ